MNIFTRITWNTMKQAKTRTVVTVIGVILSASMFTASMTLASSLFHFLKQTIYYNSGSYHLTVSNIDRDTLTEIESDERTETVVAERYIGYAAIGSVNDYKPYVYLASGDETYFQTMPLHLTAGRMPESPEEVLVPEHLLSNGGVQVKPGDVLTLAVGDRRLTGGTDFLYQTESFAATYSDENESDVIPAEELVNLQEKTYTVVGIYERPDFESFGAPGYTVLTFSDGETAASDRMTVYITVKTAFLNFDNYMEEHGFRAMQAEVNWDALVFSGIIKYNNFLMTLVGFILVFIAIIVVGSVSMIYNVFSISVGERTHQLGLLISVGATKKQIRKTIMAEAAIVSAIGIPIGILCGIGGMAVTLGVIGDYLKAWIGSAFGMTLSVSWISIFLAALISLVTVRISAWIPARRASKITAIEAVRQNKDIAEKQYFRFFGTGGNAVKKLNRFSLTKKLFGVEAVLAGKYFKRSAAKYRATVFSLMISIVLFVSANFFGQMLTETVESAARETPYSADVYYRVYPHFEQYETVLAQLRQAEGASACVYSIQQTSESIFVPEDKVSSQYRDIVYSGENKMAGYYQESVINLYVDEETYREFLRKNRIDAADTENSDGSVKGILHNRVLLYQTTVNNGKMKQVYYTLDWLKKDISALMTISRDPAAYGLPESYFVIDMVSDHDKYMVQFADGSVLTEGSMTEEEVQAALSGTLVWQEAVPEYIPLGGIAYEGFVGIPSSLPCLIYPISALSVQTADGEEAPYTGAGSVSFKTKDHKTLVTEIKKILTDNGLPTAGIYDRIEENESEHNMVITVNVFSYGFIILISLIAAANVFNSISMNISQRRRDFAMIRSMGLTRRRFHRMMGYECLIYGSVSLLLGLPIALISSFGIYLIAGSMSVASFPVPVQALLTASVCVFAVVFASMLYAVRKIKKENVIDALKSELN